MPNRHLTRPPTEIVRSRLKVLLNNINAMYQNGTQVLEEDITTAYSDALSIFIKSLDSSITSVVAEIRAGMPADPLAYNIFTSAFSKDLEALFLEVGALDKLVTSSFNSIISEREQVLQVSRRVSNKLGDYLLYADPSLGGGWFFGDSFNSAERIEVGTSLLEGDECFLGQDEGVVLLPLEGQPDRPKVKTYIINKPSNGTEGNNFQLDVIGKDELAAIGDNEPNTWFEYERVTAYEADIPLIFDLTISLDEISVINHIHINPINFGTPTPVQIQKLETSKDGLEYVSVKDEVPIKDFVSEDEDEVFQLSPATGKFSGQGFYSFLPRKAQYIHIVLVQSTPYSINTLNGSRLRYAIGVRDINVLGRRFKPEGSIISIPFSIDGDIRKISLWASENPTDASALADVSHSISENDGATWRPLQPQGRSGFDIPEIINFNNIAAGSISTDSPVTTLRHKVSMIRDPEAFEGNVTLKQEKITQTDIVNAPVGGNFSLTTTQAPISDTVRVILPFYGSYSSPTERAGDSVVGQSSVMDLDFLGFSVDVPAVDTLRFPLPYKGYTNLQEHIRVLVNGEQIEFAHKDEDALGLTGDHSTTSYVTVDEDSKVYFLNKGGRELQFGHVLWQDEVPGNGSGSPEGLYRKGFLPPAGAKIQVCLDGDNPRMELTDAGYVLNLTSSSDGFKENVSIVSLDSLTVAEATDHTIVLSPGKSKFKVHPTVKTKFTGVSKDGKKLDYPEPVGSVSTSKGLFVDDDVQDTSIEKSLDHGMYYNVTEEEGAIPPIFVDDTESLEVWYIEEYTFGGDLITSGKHFTDKKVFVDGEKELRLVLGDDWFPDADSYTFNPKTGIVYTGSPPLDDRKTVFKCKILQSTLVPEEGWEYYRSQVHERIDSGRIVLDPKYVKTYKRSVEITGADTEVTSVRLTEEETKSHSWFKQRLVKGTVVLSPELFPVGTKPTEVPFVDGDLELHSVVQVYDESVAAETGSGVHTFDLAQISSTHFMTGDPGFAPVRSVTDPTTPDSQFTELVTGTPVGDGEWSFVINVDGTVTVSVQVDDSAGLTEHYVSYRYTVADPGVDTAGLYSIDYDTGTVHFAEVITRTASVEFEISVYSAFYNIADIVSDGDIKEIDEEGRAITLSDSLGMKFLKMTSALKARPSFVKIVYEYYKKSTESLKDLEPYFSPICKDIALRAITSDVLEEL